MHLYLQFLSLFIFCIRFPQFRLFPSEKNHSIIIRLKFEIIASQGKTASPKWKSLVLPILVMQCPGFNIKVNKYFAWGFWCSVQHRIFAAMHLYLYLVVALLKGVLVELLVVGWGVVWAARYLPTSSRAPRSVLVLVPAALVPSKTSVICYD